MSKVKPLIVVCAGGLAREVIWLARETGEWDPIGFLVDAEYLRDKELCGVAYLGGIDDWPRFADAFFVVSIGSPRHRKGIVQRMAGLGEPNFATLVHPSVRKSSYVSIGHGSMITAGCILTTQIQIGRHSLVNLGCTIGHDVVIGDFCTLSPKVAVSGDITIGDGVEIGTGATLIEKLSIGTGSFIGVGSVLTKPLPENVLAVGNPARRINTLEEF
jgi:sugar O-acyltransferase (sialic acid O-acetyltransferase NeuD family)